MSWLNRRGASAKRRVTDGTPTPLPTVPGADGEVVTTSHLAFDMPTSARLDASTVKVGMHLMTQPWTRSVDDKNADTDPTNYYRSPWGPPGAVEGEGQVWATDHHVYGGLIRNRPLGRAPIGGGETAFQLADRRWEVQTARAAGYRHFYVNMQGVQTEKQARHMQCGQAAVLEGALGMMIAMPDGSAQYTTTALISQLTALFAGDGTGDYSAGWAKHTDGRWLVVPYGPEFVSDQTAAGVRSFWRTVMLGLQSAGLNACLWPVFSIAWDGPTTAQAFTHADLAPWTVGLSRWGNRDPDSIASLSEGEANFVATVQSRYSLPAMYPVSIEDSRPKHGSYSECRGWDTLVTSWGLGISKNPAMIQLPTANDWAESSGFMPSALWGYSALDASAYWLVQKKLGYTPTILRDTLYLAHRVHKAPGSTPQPTYTAGGTYVPHATNDRHGGTLAADLIDVLVFAASAGDVQILVNGSVVKTQTVAAGVTRVNTPLAEGTVSCRMQRGGVTVDGTTATSPWPVNFTSQPVQDLTYRRVSSRR